MRFVFSIHVRERMLQRGINEESVREIILNPDFVRKSFDGRKIAIKKLDKTWNVVFKEEAGDIVVISVFFD